MNGVEKIRAKWAAGQMCFGTGVGLSDPVVMEIMGETGLDMVFVDFEHGQLTLNQGLMHVLVARGCDLPVVIRVPSYDPVAIKPVMELHPAAIVVPRITNAEQAVLAVSGCKYPPKGIRGFGPARGMGYGRVGQMDYLQTADDQTMVWIQIEDIEAVKHIDAILATPGIDSIMIGPNDLSGSMGMLGQTEHCEVWKVMDAVMEKCKAQNMPVGVGMGFDADRVRKFIEKGLNWAQVNGDLGILYGATKSMLDDLRAIEKQVRA